MTVGTVFTSDAESLRPFVGPGNRTESVAPGFVLIPLVAVLIPLSRYVVPAYNRFNGRRIWRWHRALADLERDAGGGDIAVRRSEIRTRLAEAETAIDSIRVPTPLEGELYHLRHRLRALREHLES